MANFSKVCQTGIWKYHLALPQNLETLKYLKLLKVKNIKIAGNLKYYGQKNNQDNVVKIIKK